MKMMRTSPSFTINPSPSWRTMKLVFLIMGGMISVVRKVFMFLYYGRATASQRRIICEVILLRAARSTFFSGECVLVIYDAAWNILHMAKQFFLAQTTLIDSYSTLVCKGKSFSEPAMGRFFSLLWREVFFVVCWAVRLYVCAVFWKNCVLGSVCCVCYLF